MRTVFSNYREKHGVPLSVYIYISLSLRLSDLVDFLGPVDNPRI